MTSVDGLFPIWPDDGRSFSRAPFTPPPVTLLPQLSTTQRLDARSSRDTKRLRVYLLALAGAVACVAAPIARELGAQAPRPLATAGTGPFATGIVIGGDWMQATALPLDRDALPSASLSVAYRRPAWSVEAGWLRIARDLSSIQGGFLSAGKPMQWRRALFVPAISVFGGQADRSVDSTGYDFVTAAGVKGHVPRYSYSNAATFGGGVGLTVEVPVYRMLGIRADVSQWAFSGAPLEGDRARTVLGIGLSLRVRE
jgi:hypothetical protein